MKRNQSTSYLSFLVGSVCIALATLDFDHTNSVHAAVWIGPITADTTGWNNSANWSGGVPNDAGGIGASIGAAPMNFSAVGANAEFLTVGGAGGLSIQGGDLIYNGDGLIGTTAFTNGAGVVNQSAGTITQYGGGAGLLIGHNLPGEWNLSGGTLNVRVNTIIGHSAGSSNSKLSVTDTGVLNVNHSTGTQSMIIGNAAGTSREFSYTGGVGSSVTIKNDLRVGPLAAGTLTLGGAGGVFNQGGNLTFDRDDSQLHVVLGASNVAPIGGGLNAFNTLNAGTVNGTLMFIKTDGAGITGADLGVTLDVDLAPGSYAWKVIDIFPTGTYGVSGVYFEDNLVGGPGAVGYFNGLPNNTSFSVFSTPTNTEYTFLINYDGGSGNDLVLSTTVIATVPEPTAFALGIASAMCLGALIWKRRRNANG